MIDFNDKVVLILGANSDVAQQCIIQYIDKGFFIIAASRSVNSIKKFVENNQIDNLKIEILYFDSTDFDSHQKFYNQLQTKPSIVIYSAGYLVDNKIAKLNFNETQRMIDVNYVGAVSILNIISDDESNERLERVIVLSSLSGVRGRKSNFIYGSTKSAISQYLAGLRQELLSRKIVTNCFVMGYVRTKINEGLQLNEFLILEPEYVATSIVNAGKSFVIVPSFKWKIIYFILKLIPEKIVAKLP